MFRELLMVLSFGLSANLFANSTADDFPALKVYAKSLSTQTLNVMNQFDPSAHFKEYTSNPVETAHYTGVEVEHVDLIRAAQTALINDPGGKSVVENFGNKPRFEINKNNPDIQQAIKIEANSYALTHRVSNDQVHCDAKPAAICTATFHQETCDISRQLPDQTCVKRRSISVTSETVNQYIGIDFMVPKKWSGIVSINLITGSGGSVSNRLVLHHFCESMSTNVHTILNNRDPANWVVMAGAPSCQNNATITLMVTRTFNRAYPVHVDLTLLARSTPFIADEHWDNDCLNFESEANGLCHMKEEGCSDANQIRVLDGLPVSRDCWEKSVTYACSSAKVDECATQKARGCLPVSSHCVNSNELICSRYEQTYQCQDTTCPPEIVCTHDVFCADGECVDKVSTQNDNLGKDLASLAATNATGREFSQTQANLFVGHVAQCKIWATDLIDCCSDKGWGQSLDLLHCRDEDKALGQAKLNYLVHYLGKFCATKVLGECVEHKRSYCVFDSKMARLIQEGRLSQLSASVLGTAKNPTCTGMSVAELQQLDMGRIEFVKPVYPYQSGEPLEAAGIVGDIQPSFPNSSNVTNEITRRIQQKAGG